MAKKFIKFEGKIINLVDLTLIETFERWNDKINEMEFTIEVNRPYNESPLSKMSFTFNYKTEELRNQKLEILTMMLDDQEHIDIIYAE